jgi:hypothetical protein
VLSMRLHGSPISVLIARSLRGNSYRVDGTQIKGYCRAYQVDGMLVCGLQADLRGSIDHWLGLATRAEPAEKWASQASMRMPN